MEKNEKEKYERERKREEKRQKGRKTEKGEVRKCLYQNEMYEKDTKSLRKERVEDRMNVKNKKM
jgi:hypothetical protein